MTLLRAVIFDLDGVITDTAEYHYHAWQRLADEEGIPFGREANEQLRGVSRRDSLLLILGDISVSEERLLEMMARKNEYYQEMLAQISPQDLLPGVSQLLDELDEASIPYAIASASRNARAVVQRLGIQERLALVADGNSVPRAKPAPDLFRFAAAGMNLPPEQCLVVEDAAAGIEAALAAGMPALALGPAGRFEELGGNDRRFTRLDSLDDVTVEQLRTIASVDEEWVVTEDDFDPSNLHHMETVFTTGNGYFSSRGTFEEGYPDEHALTLAHGVFNDVPIFFTELVNLPNWLDLRLEVNGEPFQLNNGRIHYFRRQLDLRRGVLLRHVRWEAPGGSVVDLTFERFISYSNPHVGAMRFLLTAVGDDCQVDLDAGIAGHVANDRFLHWQHLDQGCDGNHVWLHSRTSDSDIELGTAASIFVPGETVVTGQVCPAYPSLHLSRQLTTNQTLQVDKLVAYTTSRDSLPDAEDVIGRARQQLETQDYDSLKGAHVEGWQRLWDDIDVLIEGDEEAQLAVRFNLYQLQVAAPRDDNRVSIGAKTLSGLGYRGHVFWDTEIFILPFFTYTQPDIARNLLLYRYNTLPGARRKARNNGFRGAQYAWESALTGDEVTPAWVPDPTGQKLVRIWTGDIEIHISADVAYAIMQYWQATCDDAFMRDFGAEIILDTARFWADRAEPEEVEGGRQYSFRDVIGPDEYHEHVDNNIYTNRMAQWHLETAFKVLEWLHEQHPDKARELEEALKLDEDELAHWRDVAQNILLLQDEETGLMTQFEGFFDLEELDWSQYEDRTHSMQYLLGIEGANRSQVIKQADVLMLLTLLPNEYSEKEWQVNWDTYMPLTDHQYGSSLSPSFHAWAACEMGRPDEAYGYFMLAANADLRDVRGNAGDGIHAASAGGVWQAVAFGFAGLRLQDDAYTVTPRLPAHWKRVRFKFYHCGQQHVVDVTNTDDAPGGKEVK